MECQAKNPSLIRIQLFWVLSGREKQSSGVVVIGYTASVDQSFCSQRWLKVLK